MPLLDLLLTKDHDLHISESGDIVVNHSVSQAVKVRLLWFREEWRFGPKLGVPYYQQILGKRRNTVLIEQIFRAHIEAVEEVREVRELKVQLDRPSRQLKVSFTAVTDTGLLKDEVMFHV